MSYNLYHSSSRPDAVHALGAARILNHPNEFDLDPRCLITGLLPDTDLGHISAHRENANSGKRYKHRGHDKKCSSLHRPSSEHWIKFTAREFAVSSIRPRPLRSLSYRR